MAVEGDWLVTRVQHDGRGRHGREWAGIDGNFFASTLVRLRWGDPSPPSLALAAGLALAEAVAEVAPAAALMLKWPNDLLLGGAKLAGILLERSGDRVVVGFGVNLAAAPAIDGRRTAALAPLATATPTDFAPRLATRFERLLAAWRMAEPAAFAAAWEAAAHPRGTPLSVHADAATRVDGWFDGIEPDGTLRLRRDDGSVELVRAGDVEVR